MKNFLFILLLSFICAASSEAQERSLAKSDKTSDAKTYQQMSSDEKNQFIAAESNKVLEKFGRADGDQINEQGLKLIRRFVDAYAARLDAPKDAECKFGNDLTSVLTRGSQHAKTIGDEFSSAGLPAQSGIYMAMIESEFCPCLQSPTGSLGIFQFVSTTGKLYGLNTQKGASPQNPDDRCNPQLSSQAAAKYIKKMVTVDFGKQTNSVGYPLAIGAFNSGEGGLSANLKKALESNESMPGNFWTMIANSEKLSKQFQAENFKYVPKFFAAAIVGENPQTFGVNIAPLSESK